MIDLLQRACALKSYSHFFIAGVALATLAFVTPASAQESGSMQVGGATVSVGAGTAILTLPDVEFTKFLGPGGTLDVIDRVKDSKDFDDEIGFNFNGSIAVPMSGANGGPKAVSLNGFWAKIEDDDSTSCQGSAAGQCAWVGLFDDPAISQGNSLGTAVNPPGRTVSSREVDQWGISLESAWQLTPGVMGVTRTPPQRHLSIGADIRGIDQDLQIDATSGQTAGPLSYSEDLDTTYYGAYAAWGGDYSPFLLKGLWDRWGLQSSFRVRGGVYYADTDYDGRLVDASGGSLYSQNLSLSRNKTAFIGGLVMETRKQIGARMSLSLKSEYEYYSYVPDMQYNDVDVNTGVTGPINSTSIGSDDAYSFRTSLRLTIGLGPRGLYQETAYK